MQQSLAFYYANATQNPCVVNNFGCSICSIFKYKINKFCSLQNNFCFIPTASLHFFVKWPYFIHRYFSRLHLYDYCIFFALAFHSVPSTRLSFMAYIAYAGCLMIIPRGNTASLSVKSFSYLHIDKFIQR